MNNSEILARIDHTQLKAVSTEADIDALCEEAMKYKTASVCIPPSYVGNASENTPSSAINAFVG